MIIVTAYHSKKELKASIGTFTVAHRPFLGYFKAGREFFAEVTMKNDIIVKVT